LRTEDILAEIQSQGEELAIVLLSGVQYFTGQFFNIKEITQAAHSVVIYQKIYYRNCSTFFP
jgi:kynureninase